jgi:hypothetical protein
LGFQALIFISISICSAATYLSYTYLFHGERIEPVDYSRKAYTRHERRFARFAVAFGLISGILLAFVI